MTKHVHDFHLHDTFTFACRHGRRRSYFVTYVAARVDNAGEAGFGWISAGEAGVRGWHLRRLPFLLFGFVVFITGTFRADRR